MTLCGPFWNHLHSKTVPHWFQHWLFSTHRVEHNQRSVLHTSSIHPWVCIAQCQEGWVPGLYSSCKIAKALSIIIRTHPSNSYNVIHPALELHAIKNKQTSNYPGTSVLRCRGSLNMVMYKLYNKPARKVLA